MKKVIILISVIILIMTACNDSSEINLNQTFKQTDQTKGPQRIAPLNDTIQVILGTAPYPSPSNELQLWISNPLSFDLGIYLKVKESKNPSDLLFCPTIYIPAGQKYVNFDLPDYRKSVTKLGSDSIVVKTISKLYVQICGLENNQNNKFLIDCSILQINYDLINNSITTASSNWGFVKLGLLNRSSVNFYFINGGSPGGGGGPIVPPSLPID